MPALISHSETDRAVRSDLLRLSGNHQVIVMTVRIFDARFYWKIIPHPIFFAYLLKGVASQSHHF
jgi:hypothetical protein